MSCCSFCCPWRHPVESEPKNQQSLGLEATSTPSSGSAMIKTNDENNNKDDCSVSAEDIDDSVVIRQPFSSDAAGDVERKALMASSEDLDHSDVRVGSVKNASALEVNPDRDAMDESRCLAEQESDSALDLKDEMELLLISDDKITNDSESLMEDVSFKPVIQSASDRSNENALHLNLTVEFDEQPDQELLDFLLEVLKHRPAQPEDESELVQGEDSQTEPTVSDAENEDELIKSVEQKIESDPITELSINETDQVLDSELEQDLIKMPSKREENEELLRLLQSVNQHRMKQGLKKPAQKSKLQIKPYKQVLMPIIPPFKVGSENQLNAFKQQMLDAHNYYRAHHSAPPLTPCPELRMRAQNWADYIALRDLQLLEPQSLDGNNWGCVEVPDGVDEVNGAFFVNGWYKQCQNYAFFGQDQERTEIGSSESTAQFEQLVWKASLRVGFGRAVSANGRVFVVARYRPPGRVPDEFAANVLPPANGAMAPPV